jgi:hypothetical protein
MLWISNWDAMWRWHPPTISCTGTTGANLLRINDISNPITDAQDIWKKLPGLIVEIGKAWVGEGPIRLMFMDEARFGRISDARRCWCPKPICPVCYAMVSQEYRHAYAPDSISDGTTDSLILPHVNGECM